MCKGFILVNRRLFSRLSPFCKSMCNSCRTTFNLEMRHKQRFVIELLTAMDWNPKILFIFYMLLSVTKSSHNLLFISRNRCKVGIARALLYFLSEFIIPLDETFAVKIQIIYFLCHIRLNFQPHSSSGSANMSALSFVGKWVFIFSKEIVGIMQPILKIVTQSLVKMFKPIIRLFKLYTNRTKLIFEDTRILTLLLTLAILGYSRTGRITTLSFACSHLQYVGAQTTETG